MNIERLTKASELLRHIEDEDIRFDMEGLHVDVEAHIAKNPWHQSQGVTYEKGSLVFNGKRSIEALMDYFDLPEARVEYLFDPENYTPKGFGRTYWEHLPKRYIDFKYVTAGQCAERFLEVLQAGDNPEMLAA